MARYYDPVTHIFVSQDPLGLAPDSNSYRYAGNSPTNATDPSGLLSELGFGEGGYGHHYVDVAALKDKKIRDLLEKEAIAVALGTATGPEHAVGDIDSIHRYRTYGGVKHSEYNAKVKEVLKNYYKYNNNGTKKITGEQMLQITKDLSMGVNPVNTSGLSKAEKKLIEDDIKAMGDFNAANKKLAANAAKARGKLLLPFPKDVKEAMIRGQQFAFGDGKARIKGKGLLTRLATIKLLAGFALAIKVAPAAAQGYDRAKASEKVFTRIEQVAERVGEQNFGGACVQAAGTGGELAAGDDRSVRAAIGELARELGGLRSDFDQITAEAAFEEWFYNKFSPKELINEYNDLIDAAGFERPAPDAAQQWRADEEQRKWQEAGRKADSTRIDKQKQAEQKIEQAAQRAREQAQKEREQTERDPLRAYGKYLSSLSNKQLIKEAELRGLDPEEIDDYDLENLELYLYILGPP